MPTQKGIKSIALNRKARHDYFIEDSIEAGIELVGTEVKSLRGGHVQLRDSFVRIKNGEAFVHGIQISPYEKGNVFNRDPLRVRKLLLHKSEIRKLDAKVMQESYSLIPLKLYFKNGRIKMELAIAKGKKLYDKRHTVAERDVKRDMERAARRNSYD